MTITCPLELKKLFFPERISEWNLMQDILNVHIIKQNEGGLGFCQYVFDPDTLRIVSYKNNNSKEEKDYEEEKE